MVDTPVPEEETMVNADEMQARAEQAEAKAQENWDLFLRARADLENYKRRTERDLAAMIRRGKRDLVLRLLEVADSLERAVAWEEDHRSTEESQHEGIALIHRQLVRVLGDAGVEPVDALGQPFDPTLHEAVAVDAGGSAPEDVITAVLQPGYTFEGELLRPARVVVSRPAGT